jgi:kanamycin kinase
MSLSVMASTVAGTDIRWRPRPRAQHNERMIAAPPEGPFTVPGIVERLAVGRPVKAVWRNSLGGITFQLGTGPGREFLKWSPPGVDLSAELDRLEWAVRYATVPRVLTKGSDEQGSWFVTAGLPGRSAVDERWKKEPATAVRAIGAGLRSLHEALPVADCPFERSVETRLATARANAAAGRIDTAEWHEETWARVSSVEQALELVTTDIPTVDRLVVCQGDTCSPNTLIGADGKCSGHVDLGALGVADRWADLAVASWATTWNYGPGWEEPLLEAYGVAPDRERIRYYRLLWQLVD